MYAGDRCRGGLYGQIRNSATLDPELAPSSIREILRKLLGYSGLQVEDRSAVLRALGFHDKGMDFADALHLASTRKGQSLEGVPEVLLLGTKRA